MRAFSAVAGFAVPPPAALPVPPVPVPPLLFVFLFFLFCLANPGKNTSTHFLKLKSSHVPSALIATKYLNPLSLRRTWNAHTPHPIFSSACG